MWVFLSWSLRGSSEPASQAGELNMDSTTGPLQSPLPPPQAKTAAAKRAGGGVWRLGLVVFVVLAPLRLHIDIGCSIDMKWHCTRTSSVCGKLNTGESTRGRGCYIFDHECARLAADNSPRK